MEVKDLEDKCDQFHTLNNNNKQPKPFIWKKKTGKFEVNRKKPLKDHEIISNI